jgi:hypothetical protein
MRRRKAVRPNCRSRTARARVERHRLCEAVQYGIRSVLDNADVEGLVRLFNIESKRDLEKYCRDFVVRQNDFVAFILVTRAGGLEPYRYASHFAERIPSHLRATDEELAALSQNGIGPLQGKAWKAVSKTFQLFEDRRCSAAHLFYTPDYAYWYLFYSDRRDEAATENHWQNGSHIHLISSHWPNLRLEKVWQQVRAGHTNFANKIHLRFLLDITDL